MELVLLRVLLVRLLELVLLVLGLLKLLLLPLGLLLLLLQLTLRRAGLYMLLRSRTTAIRREPRKCVIRLTP